MNGQFFHFVDFNSTEPCHLKSFTATKWSLKTSNPFYLAEDSILYENQRIYSDNRKYYATLSSKTCVVKIVDIEERKTIWRSHRSLLYLAKNRRFAQCHLKLERNGRLVIFMDNTEHWKENNDEWRIVWKSRTVDYMDHHQKILTLDDTGVLYIKSLDDNRILKRFN
jgi:hypothetical protein